MYLVTGGAGFIGSHIADHLMNSGEKVVVLDDLSGGFAENVRSSLFIEGSILDQQIVEWIFKRWPIEYVIHAAAYAAEGLSPFIRRFNYQNNLVGSINLINASVKYKVKSFVFLSSMAVYGNAPTPMTEDMQPMPVDPYGIAKYAVELDLWNAHQMFGLNYVVFRPHNVIGERQNIADPYRNVVGIFMNNALQDKPLPIFGDGTQMRAFTHVADVAPIIAKSATHAGAQNKVFNIGADKPYSINELAVAVQLVMNKKVGVTYLPARHEVHTAFTDHSKLERVFKYKAAIELHEGLKRMAAWVKSVGPRQSKPFDGVELNEGLPGTWKQ